MTVGIVGLGLIGGSFAKAYHAAGHTVLAFDTDRSTYDFAVRSTSSLVLLLISHRLPDCICRAAGIQTKPVSQLLHRTGRSKVVFQIL